MGLDGNLESFAVNVTADVKGDAFKVNTKPTKPQRGVRRSMAKGEAREFSPEASRSRVLK